jgi:hypothetical protein
VRKWPMRTRKATSVSYAVDKFDWWWAWRAATSERGPNVLHERRQRLVRSLHCRSFRRGLFERSPSRPDPNGVSYLLAVGPKALWAGPPSTCQPWHRHPNGEQWGTERYRVPRTCRRGRGRESQAPAERRRRVPRGTRAVTSTTSASSCVFCGEPATETIDPPRRTLARGLDPGDPTYSVTVILPDIALCVEHSRGVRQGERLVGWCDDPSCRMYGALGEPSACGRLYEKLTPTKRS